MKKIGYILLVVIWTGCIKTAGECPKITAVAPPAEVEALRSYLTSNAIVATEDYRGFFYVIGEGGTGENPTTCDDITVNYTGELTDGTEFDGADNIIFPLSNLIIGWQAGLPLIKPGGKITLYLPPSMGYGAAGGGPVPPNSITIFDIDLIKAE
jgi:FKBP-type peptidyl-prolyl cis-trans isomerase FkpA